MYWNGRIYVLLSLSPRLSGQLMLADLNAHLAYLLNGAEDLAPPLATGG